MIKKIVIYIILGGMVLGLLSINSISSFATDEEEQQYTKDAVAVFSCAYDGFQAFIQNPSRAVDELQNYGITISYIKKENDTSGRVLHVLRDKDSFRVEIREEGELFIGNLSVYRSFLDLINDWNNLKGLLQKHGITGELDDVTLLDVSNMAATIWVTVSGKDYFITVDEQFEDYAYRTDESAYVYRIYAFAEYFEKFSAKDGKLIVSGEDITNGNYVKFHYTGVYLPLRSVLEHLGVRVDWDAKQNVILLCHEKKQYVFDPHDFKLVEQEAKENLLRISPGESYYYCEILNGRTILSEEAMRLIVRKFGAEIRVNYDSQVVEISKA